MTDTTPRDTGDLMAEHEAAGGADPNPSEVHEGDADYVEPYAAAHPVGVDASGGES